MIEDKYIELMNQEIDGVNTAADSDELHHYLEQSPEGRRYYDELCGMTQALSQADPIDPPLGLKREILSKLRPKTSHARTPFFDALRARFRPKYAYTFAVGLLAGICLYAIFSSYSSDGNRLNRDSLYGTIAFESVKGSPSSTIPVEFDLAEAAGTATFTYFERAVVAQVNVRTEQQIDLLLEYPDNLVFEVFKTLVSTDHDLQTENGTLRVTNRGVSDFVIVFKETAKSHQTLRLKVLSEGNLLFEKTIEPGRM